MPTRASLEYDMARWGPVWEIAEPSQRAVETREQCARKREEMDFLTDPMSCLGMRCMFVSLWLIWDRPLPRKGSALVPRDGLRAPLRSKRNSPGESDGGRRTRRPYSSSAVTRRRYTGSRNKALVVRRGELLEHGGVALESSYWFGPLHLEVFLESVQAHRSAREVREDDRAFHSPTHQRPVRIPVFSLPATYAAPMWLRPPTQGSPLADTFRIARGDQPPVEVDSTIKSVRSREKRAGSLGALPSETWAWAKSSAA